MANGGDPGGVFPLNKHIQDALDRIERRHHTAGSVQSDGRQHFWLAAIADELTRLNGTLTAIHEMGGVIVSSGVKVRTDQQEG